MNKTFILSALFCAAAGGAFAQSANPILQGAATCSTVAQQLPARPLAGGVLLIADPGNTGSIYVGGSTVAASGANQPPPLAAGAAVSLPVTSLASVWFVCANSADTLHYLGN